MSSEKRESNRKLYYIQKARNPHKYNIRVQHSVALWRARFPGKYRAQQKVYIELRAGRLVRGICFCGKTEVEAHHPDYRKPLAVIWFCRTHHRMADRGELLMV